jgi:FKBP-type peptidyl-prolyl cis-trans isomerase SlyD
MNTNKKATKGVVVGIEYILTIDGEIIDETQGESLEYLHGYANIISGLEKEIEELNIGDNKKVSIPPEDAYGEYDETQLVEIPRSEFPEDIPFVPGLDIEMTSVEGEVLIGTIEEVLKDNVLVNFNHPLAGETLDFDVTVVTIRDATQEELEHGHVHQGHDHHH